MILAELQQVMPSFVSRVERPERGGEWISYLQARRARHRAAGSRGSASAAARKPTRRPSVDLLHVEGGEDDLLAACLFEAAARRRSRRSSPRIDALDARRARRELLAAMVGERANRRHRPGRGFEALRYRFEIVSDYGAFRDLQRHRMLTVQWQRLGPDLGAGVPEEVREAGVGGEFERALEISRDEYERLAAAGLDELAPYALSLAYRIRYVARPQRARGDAPDRAALRPRGPPHLPRRRPGDARARSPPSTPASPRR